MSSYPQSIIRQSPMLPSIIIMSCNQLQLQNRIIANQSLSLDLPAKLTTHTLFLGPYLFTKYLSSGAFGAVYRGVDTRSGRSVAIKLIDVEQLFEKNKSAQVRAKLMRYLQSEEELLRKCHSANVVKLYDVFENDKCKVLVLQFCSGGGLDGYVNRRWSLKEDDAVLVLRQVLLGLAELHRNNIIHRDLKPANILLHEGLFKIADFGFAVQLASPKQIGQITVCGSRNTMAPEVKNYEAYGLKADIWSLGMIFFLMVYADQSVAYSHRHEVALKVVDSGRKFRFRTKNGWLSEEAVDFLGKTLVRDQKKRMNWQELLTHPLFSRKFRQLPEEYNSVEVNLADIREVAAHFPQGETHRDNQQDEPQESIKLVESPIAEQSKRDIEPPKVGQLAEQYLDCRKAEFILHQMIIPLADMINPSRRSHIELLLLLSVRCQFNILFARDAAESISASAKQQFLSRTEELAGLANQKFKYYCEQLCKIQSKVGEMLKDKFNQVTSSTEYKQREKFLTTGIEGENYTRSEQIAYTYEKYLVDAINELQGDTEQLDKMRGLFKVYRQINAITMEELGEGSLEGKIDKIVKSIH